MEKRKQEKSKTKTKKSPMQSSTDIHPLGKQLLWWRYIAFSLSFFLIDTLTKLLFKQSTNQTSGHWIDITFVQNTGTMWSLFHSLTFINAFFITLSIIAILFLIYTFRAYASRTNSWGLALITGGIMGNLLDRILYGAVSDWINLHWWPIFNFADTFIVVGAILTTIWFLKNE